MTQPNQASQSQVTGTLPTSTYPLTEISIPPKIKQCLIQAYSIYLAKYSDIRNDINVLFDLSRFEEFADQWTSFCNNFPASDIYKAFILDFYRTRKPHPEKYRIRWFRKEWYGPEDFEAKPQIAWKLFAQRIGSLKTNELNEENEYKKLNKALSQLIDNNIITYNDIRILNIAHDKNAIRPTMKSFRHEKGWKRVILCIEKTAMFTDDLLDFCKKYGLIVIAGGGEPSRSANETLYRILEGKTCLKCLKNKTETKRSFDIKCVDGYWNHDFYDYDELIHIITITDFDPAGEYISNTFQNHFQTYTNVEYARIGLTKEQIEGLNLPEHKFYKLKPSYQGWEEAFTIHGESYGVEMDSISWHFYFELIINKLTELLGPEGWNEYALEQSADTYEDEKEELIRKKAEEWIQEEAFQSPLYQLFGYQINEINTIIDKLYEKQEMLSEKQTECINPLIELIENYFANSNLEDEEDFDEREEITEEILTEMLNYVSFEKTVKNIFNKESVLDNDSLIEKIDTFLEENKEEIKNQFLEEED